MDDWLKERAVAAQAGVLSVRRGESPCPPLYFTTRRTTYSDVMSVVTTTRPAASSKPQRSNKELRRIKMPLRAAVFTSPLRCAGELEDEERARRNKALWAENVEFMARLQAKRELRQYAEVAAATRIQSAFRLHLVAHNYAAIKKRAIVRKRVRQGMRGCCEGAAGEGGVVVLAARDRSMRRNAAHAHAALAVQVRYRGILGRRAAAKERHMRHEELHGGGSVLLQCMARSFLARRAVRKLRASRAADAARGACLLLQTQYRRHRARRLVALRRVRLASLCATLLQRAMRRHLACKAARKERVRSREARTNGAAMDVQRIFRGKRGRRRHAYARNLEVEELREACALAVQRCYRGRLGRTWHARTARRQKLEAQLMAALHIQRAMRGALARVRCAELMDERSDDIFAQARLGEAQRVDDLYTGLGGLDGEASHTPNDLDVDGNTLLLVAARWGHHKIVRKCLRWGFEINHENDAGFTALQLAVGAGRGGTAEYLITKKAEFSNFGRTLLHDAAAAGLLGTTKELLLRGVPVNELDDDLRTPLHEAARRAPLAGTTRPGVDADAQAVVEALLGAGASVAVADRDGAAPLHCAAAAGRLSIVASLLEAGADVGAKDGAGKVAWQLAVKAGHGAAAAALKEHWCKITGQDSMMGLTGEGVSDENRAEALRLAAAGDKGGVEVLLDCGLEAGHADERTGNTLLHLAAKAGAAPLVELCLARGGDAMAVNTARQLPLHLGAATPAVSTLLLAAEGGKRNSLGAPDTSGRTPLHEAAARGVCFPAADLGAMSVAASSLVDESGRTPLHELAQCCHLGGTAAPTPEVLGACCLALLQAGVNGAAADARKRTVLHLAALSDGGASVARTLLKQATLLHGDGGPGAAPLLAAQDGSGRTPVHVAASKGAKAMLDALLEGSHADTSALDLRSRMAVHHAAEAGSAPCLRLLLAGHVADSFLAHRDADGHTLLHAALHAGSAGCVHLLLERQADHLETYPGGETTLHVAARRGFEDGVFQLLGAGMVVSAACCAAC